MTAYANELADPDVLGGHEEHALLRGASWRRFAVIGDSVAAGVGDPVPGYLRLTWAERVARGLRTHHPELAYLNVGVQGLRAREVRETQLAAALAFAPDLACVTCGGNDAMARDFDPDAVEEELDAMVGALRASGADVFTFTYFDITQAVELPEPWGPRLRDRMGTLNAMAVAIADRHGAFVADCAAHPRSADRAIYSDDLLHLNLRGQAVAASEAIRVLSPASVEAAGVG